MIRNNPRSRAYWAGRRYTKHAHVYAHAQVWRGDFMVCEICGKAAYRRDAARAIDEGALVRSDAAQPGKGVSL